MAEADPGAPAGRAAGPFAGPFAGLAASGAFAPLRERTFRTIWSASLLSNFGQLILGVGAAWAMTGLTGSADMVALVQTATMGPLMLVALPAGAIADMFDRRRVALYGLGFALLCATVLTILAWLDLISPQILLAACFMIGVGGAIFGPAWQASVGEQVRAEHLPAAVALNSISYNIARSFGPALGGFIVVAVGAAGAFAATALLYLPIILALYLWRRERPPARLPPERVDRAIVAGMRYVLHSPVARTVLMRTFIAGFAAASVTALMPLVARDLLNGGALTYGMMLGAFGVGAVAGALCVSSVRERMDPEHATRLAAIGMGAAMIVAGASGHVVLTGAALFVAGIGYILMLSTFNVGVQTSAPRWVTARALASFQATIAGALAFGAWSWGTLAGHWGVAAVLIVSGLMMVASVLAGLALPMPRITAGDAETRELSEELTPALALTHRSGPIVIEIDYRVDPKEARAFYAVMQHVQRTRQRTGAFEWSLSRDIADPALWTERYHCPTWLDYLRQRTRATRGDREVQESAFAFHISDSPPVVRRRLERPLGSVRWRENTPDPEAPIGLVTP